MAVPSDPIMLGTGTMTEPPDADRRPRLVVAGAAGHDLIYRVAAFPARGSKTVAADFASVGGGSAANAAVAARRLGASVRLVCPLGDDMVGAMIARDLAAEGIDLAAIVIAGGHSPVTAAIVEADGERTVLSWRTPGGPPPPIPDPDGLAAGSDAVLADDRFLDFVAPLLAAARRRGRPAVLDGDRADGLPPAALAMPSHAILSAACLAATTGLGDPADGLRAAARMTDAFLAVTLGARGVVWLDRAGAIRHLHAPAIAAVDTLGAGDVFHGAFALALAEGRSEAEALGFATVAAALKCRRFGGRAGAPTRAELDAFLQDPAD